MPLELAGRDRAAIKNQPGDIQPRQGHDAAGNSFVAPDQHHQGIEEIAPRDQLNRIGNNFAADQRCAHALRPHGDAIGDGHGVEFQRSAARGADAFLDVFGEFAQVIVAGADFNPGVGDAHQRFVEIVVLQSAGAQHGSGGGAIRAVGKHMTSRLEHLVPHFDVPPSAQGQRKTRKKT
jgi:hypothetical protein